MKVTIIVYTKSLNLQGAAATAVSDSVFLRYPFLASVYQAGLPGLQIIIREFHFSHTLPCTCQHICITNTTPNYHSLASICQPTLRKAFTDTTAFSFLPLQVKAHFVPSAADVKVDLVKELDS